MSRFKGLTTNIAAKSAPVASPAAEEPDDTSTRAKARVGKKAVVGYFSPDLSRDLRMLSIQEGITVQALLGEAIDLLLRQRGKHPYGER